MGFIIKISTLSDVKPFKSIWRVNVKVFHTWKSFTPQFDSSIEMGVKIHASCKKSFPERLARYCRVGEWKVITNFTLSPASGLYRPTNHVYKLSFVSQTSITYSTLQCNNMFFGIQDFDTILSGSLNICFLIDVIGEVLDLEEMGIVQCQGKERKKVEALTSEVTEPNNENICLIRFAKLGKYKELQVSNSFDSYLMFINREIKKANALKQMFHGENNSIELYETKEEKNVIQKTIICLVYTIDTDYGWHFYVVCNKKVFKMYDPNEDLKVPNWWCEVYTCVVTKVSHRYKLHLLVKDQTGESKFMLLDSIAKTIVKESSAKLLNDLELLPNEIFDLVGKTYGFGIAVANNNSSTKKQCTKAIKIEKVTPDAGKEEKSG
ncbi:hypothetical protein N665_0072s0041 [Sinapis alba]|nr:hypothetical protein N665_0072s0041 [Sinapis alba]